MMKPTIMSFTSSSEELVQCYIDVFGEAPWNEGYISELTGVLYPLSTTEFGDDVVKPYYDSQELIRQRNERSSKQGFIGQLAQVLDDSQTPSTVGFIAGWKTNLEELNSEKLGLDNCDILCQNIVQQFPDFVDQNLFYAADLGVVSSYRNQGIARQLYDARQTAMIEKGAQWVIVRTMKGLAKPYQWYIDRCGFVSVYDYDDQQDRVILVSRITNEDN